MHPSAGEPYGGTRSLIPIATYTPQRICEARRDRVVAGLYCPPVVEPKAPEVNRVPLVNLAR